MMMKKQYLATELVAQLRVLHVLRRFLWLRKNTWTIKILMKHPHFYCRNQALHIGKAARILQNPTKVLRYVDVFQFIKITKHKLL